jgi:hypothetical protein
MSTWRVEKYCSDKQENEKFQKCNESWVLKGEIGSVRKDYLSWFNQVTSHDYFQMYKTLQLFTSIITSNTNIFIQASKVLKDMYIYLYRHKH